MTHDQPPLSPPQLQSLKPKAPVTAYMLYCQTKREAMQKKHPSFTAREITAKLSERWAAKNDAQKVRELL